MWGSCLSAGFFLHSSRTQIQVHSTCTEAPSEYSTRLSCVQRGLAVGKNQWTLSDLFQNRHLIKQHGNYLTATDLYDARVRSDSALFTVYQTDSNRIEQITKAIRDPYFSKSYYLIFFEQTDPEIVYSWKNKWRHYLLDYSHFQIYDPLGPSSNFRHRVKQFVFFGWLLWLVIFAVRLTKRIP